MSNDWKCSKCGEVPEVMQANTNPPLCVKCYDEQRAATPTERPAFDTGTRVATPSGPGTVAYVRMGGPDFAEVSSVSVVLDAKKNQPGYTGSIFMVEFVSALPKPVSRNQRGKV